MEYPVELQTDTIDLKVDTAQLCAELTGQRSLSDEAANTLTHGVGLLMSLAGAGLLFNAAVEHAQPGVVAGCVIYAATLIAVYAASTASHAVGQPRLKQRLRSIDQAAIYLLCAGSFTPFALAYCCEDGWWMVLVAMWAVALAGFASKVLWAHRVESVCLVAYMVLGWMPILAARPALEHAPFGALAWAVYGGACYTAGTAFLARDEKYPYFHAVWHLLVIAGSTCHFIVTFNYVVR